MAKYKLPKIDELFEAGVHFGHQVKKWHPGMQGYIHSVKKNLHIINLEKTLEGLEKACDFLYETAKSGGDIVFVGTKKQAVEAVEKNAVLSGAKFVNERWLGGTISNQDVIYKNVEKLLNHLRNKEEGNYQKYTKKERLMIDREVDELQKLVGGIVGLRVAPKALFVIDSKKEKTAIKEAKKAGIKIIALVDTNSDPKGIDYIIAGNDDAVKAISLITKVIGEAVEAGYKEFVAKQKIVKEVPVKVEITKEIKSEEPKKDIEVVKVKKMSENKTVAKKKVVKVADDKPKKKVVAKKETK